jgi:hypothetical protein
MTMPLFLIAFELNSDVKDYTSFLSRLKQQDSIQLSSRTFAMHSNQTPREVYDGLAALLDRFDPLYVVPLAGPMTARAVKEKNEWLVERLDINIYKAMPLPPGE